MTQTEGGAANKEKEELQNNIDAVEKLLEEKDHHIGKLKAIRQELKEQQSEIQFIKTKEEREKSSLLRKIRDMRNEIISLKERRTPLTESHPGPHKRESYYHEFYCLPYYWMPEEKQCPISP